MAHHGNDPINPKMREQFEKLKDTTAFRGATGEFPEQKMRRDDEGAIQFAVGHENGKVVLDFGTPVVWVGMSADDAVRLAQALLDHARQCSDGVLTFQIGGSR